MRSSKPLFDELAADYDGHFSAPHRRAYDELAWEHVVDLLPGGDAPALVVDAGCGVGRWAARLIELGHCVIGIEQATAMIEAARARRLGPGFTLIEGSMDDVDLGRPEADLVLAMGSLQYSRDPEQTVARFAGWARPGGAVCVLVDSYVALVLELLRAGRIGEALRCVETRVGTWTRNGISADLHLLDQARLEAAFDRAGLVNVRTLGLLVGASAFGPETLKARLCNDWQRQFGLERRLAADPLLANLGKQILASGRTEEGERLTE